VTIENKGSSGWLVQVFDQPRGLTWSHVRTDAGDHSCQAGAYEQSDHPVYDYLTRTTPVVFGSTRVWWAEKARTGAGKLLATPPAGATLHRYDLVNSYTTIAAASAPASSDSTFTVTDAPVRLPPVYTPNLAGYEVTQSAAQGYPYTGVQATWTLPAITKTDPNSYAFAYYLAGINGLGDGGMAGIEESMLYGSVSYQAFGSIDGQVQPMGITVSPGDTITASVTIYSGQQWNVAVADQTTGEGAAFGYGVTGLRQYDAEVAELRPANPIGPGYLPLAATTPVTFDHASFTNTSGATYPFQTVLPGGSLSRLQMRATAPATTIAATSQPDSDMDGFTVQDGATVPAPPES
jgi:Peptidase A4 family